MQEFLSFISFQPYRYSMGPERFFGKKEAFYSFPSIFFGMLADISYYLIFGKPLIFYLGIITIFLLFCTALIGFSFQKRIWKIQFKWHTRLAVLTLLFALIHGVLAVLLYL